MGEIEQAQEELLVDEQQEQQQENFKEAQEEQAFMNDPSNQNAGLDYGDMTGYSENKPIGGLYALFENVLNRPDSIRVSNVDPKTELGDLGITIRDCERIALIGNTFHHARFADFFHKQALIVTDTAMSKKGWFPELFISSKKFAEKNSSSNLNLPQQQPQAAKKKWSLFGSQ
jgi:hypothetical protein